MNSLNHLTLVTLFISLPLLSSETSSFENVSLEYVDLKRGAINQEVLRPQKHVSWQVEITDVIVPPMPAKRSFLEKICCCIPLFISNAQLRKYENLDS